MDEKNKVYVIVPENSAKQLAVFARKSAAIQFQRRQNAAYPPPDSKWVVMEATAADFEIMRT